MPLATITLTLDDSDHCYVLPINDEFPADLILSRVPNGFLETRLQQLSKAATTWTPSPLFNLLPFLAPWFMIFPVLAVARDGAQDSSTRSSSGADWTGLIIVCTLAFFVSMSVGPIYIHKCLVRRHQALKCLLDEFTLLDAFQSDRHLLWRFPTRPDGDDSPNGVIEWHPESYETTVELVILAPTDCLDENGNIIALDSLLGGDRELSDGVVVHVDPELVAVADPPPAYSAMGEAAEKPPEYTMMPLTLYDAEFELHHGIGSGTASASSGGDNTSLPLGTQPGPMVRTVPIVDAPARTAARISRMLPPALTPIWPTFPGPHHPPATASSNCSSDFGEININDLAPPPRSASLFRAQQPSSPTVPLAALAAELLANSASAASAAMGAMVGSSSASTGIAAAAAAARNGSRRGSFSSAWAQCDSDVSRVDGDSVSVVIEL
ncbi:hypothetical protein BCR44DRAFT_1435781 [Catenaria anguillulae PL171]|uniref:Uncharacterized protein n=1 Tax=Catenaria anguillulae PL171 TaxID=765915 RepID=A0A1Y2HJM7_9FUNG|nr:hypothetical protein BCR44DRAFT_1435781 [Catenaria anguillulae PL171]